MTGGRIWFAVSTGRISTEKFREVDKKSFFEFREVETARFLLFASGIALFFFGDTYLFDAKRVRDSRYYVILKHF